MNGNPPGTKHQPEQAYYLSELLKTRVTLHGRRLGKLDDLVIVDRDKFAEVTHLCVSQSFGRPTVIVPWEHVKVFTGAEVVVDIPAIDPFTHPLPVSAVLLNDHILDKKVLDVEDRDVEIVYDVKLTLRNNRLFVIEVDLSRASLLRRIGMKWLANLLYGGNGRGKDQIVPWSYIEPLPESLGSFQGDLKLKVLKEQFAAIPPVDLADILEELGHEQRMAIFDELDTAHASDTLEELDPSVQRSLVASLTKDRVARLIDLMTPAQAADLLAVLPMADAQAILKLLNKENSTKIKSILEQQESEILSFAVSRYISLPPEMTIREARAEFKRRAMGKEHIGYLYVLDKEGRLLGTLDVRDLLMAEDDTQLQEVMIRRVISLTPENTLKEAHEMFARYNFRAIPILDDQDKMLGVLPDRDVVNLRHRYME